MNQSLAIGILDPTPGWQILLDWAGLEWRPLYDLRQIEKNITPVVILNRHLWSEEFEQVDKFLRDGGAALDCARFLPSKFPWQFDRTWIGSLSDNDHLGLLDDLILDLDSVCTKSNIGGNNGIVYGTSNGDAPILYLGFDPGNFVADLRRRTIKYPAKSDRAPEELVSLVSKGEIGILVERAIKQLYSSLSLPFVRKRKFPGKHSNVSAFRIDTDYGNAQQLKRLDQVSRQAQIEPTWFVHSEGHSGFLSVFSQLSGEVSLHGARHKTFRGFKQNLTNIGSCRSELRELGIETEGFSSPNGLWNFNLADAIDEQSLLYSSEFSLARDALPFFPILPNNWRANRSFYNAIQIPVHPIAIGSLKHARMSGRQIVDYFSTETDRRMRLELPLIYYHHPTHESWEETAAMLETTKLEGVLHYTFRQFATWWKGRSKTWFSANLESNRVSISERVNRGGTDVTFEMTTPDGRSSTHEIGDTVPLDRENCKDLRAYGRTREDVNIARLRRRNPREVVRATRNSIIRFSR